MNKRSRVEAWVAQSHGVVCQVGVQVSQLAPDRLALQARYGLLCLALLIAGCAVGPDFTKPEVPSPKAWRDIGDPKVKAERVDYRAWWQVFDDSVLNKLIQTAYRQNLPLQAAGLRILEARAQLGIATGSQYPQFQQGRAGYSYTRISENANPISTVPPELADQIVSGFETWDLGFDAIWELDLWGKYRRGVESAEASLIASVASYDDVLVSVTAEVASAYLAIRTFQERLELTRQNVAVQQRSLEITEVRFENGATTELDVRQAESLLRDTEALIPQLETGLRQTQNALSTLLGMPPSDLGVMLAGPAPIPKPPVEVAVGIPADLLRRRPDIRAAELEAAAQSARIGVALSDLYPSFTLTGSIGVQAEDIGQLFKGGSLVGFIGPAFRWNLFNYGRIRNNVRAQDARFQQLVATYQNAVLKAYQEVEDALVAYLRAQQQADFLAKGVKASQRSVDLALVQYRDGAADYTRVLNTQQSLVTAQDRLTETRGDIVRNLVALYKALGGGWQLREGKDFVPESTVQEMRQRTNWGKLLPPEQPALDQGPPPPAKAQPLLRQPVW